MDYISLAFDRKGVCARQCGKQTSLSEKNVGQDGVLLADAADPSGVAHREFDSLDSDLIFERDWKPAAGKRVSGSR